MSRLLSALRRIEARTEANRLTAPADGVSTVEPVPVNPPAWTEEPFSPWADAFNYSPEADCFAPWGELTPTVSVETDAAGLEKSESPELADGGRSAVAPPSETGDWNVVADANDATHDGLLSDDAPQPQADTADQESADHDVPEISVTLEAADVPDAHLVLPSSLTEPAEASQPADAPLVAGENPSDLEQATTADLSNRPPSTPAPPEQNATVQLPPPAKTHAEAPEPARNDEEEPGATIRLPGFGRPRRRGRSAGSATLAGSDPSSLVPFKPAAQRPYREMCENLVSAVRTGKGAALVFSWADEDLDHAVLAARMAETLADRIEDPVLLIDLGPNRRLSHLLHAATLGSLNEVMAGFVSWRDQIVQTSTAGLCVLPSGPHDFDADPVAVARLIEACKEDFGFVLITGAALGGIPENLLLAADAAVLLIEAGHTGAATASGAIERIRRCGAEVIGCVLTGVSD